MRNIFFFMSALFISWLSVTAINSSNNSGIFFMPTLKQEQYVAVKRVQNVIPAAIRYPSFEEEPDIDITARSAILLETRSNRVIFERNVHEVHPSASLVKIFTGIVAFENYPLDQHVQISTQALSQNGSRYKTFWYGEVYTVEMLLHSLLVESSNVAAYALAQVMGYEKFVDAMSAKADLLGFTDTVLLGPSGLDSEGSQTSAWEIAKLGEYLLYFEEMDEILRMGKYSLYDVYGNFKREMFTTNELWGIEGLVAAKTGFTDEALGNLLIIMRHPKKEGEFLISVVMGSQDRAADTLKLLQLVR